MCDMTICSNMKANTRQMQLKRNSRGLFSKTSMSFSFNAQTPSLENMPGTTASRWWPSSAESFPRLSRCILRHCHRGRACGTLPGLQGRRSTASPQQIRSGEKEVRAVEVALYHSGTPPRCKGAWVI